MYLVFFIVHLPVMLGKTSPFCLLGIHGNYQPKQHGCAGGKSILVDLVAAEMRAPWMTHRLYFLRILPPVNAPPHGSAVLTRSKASDEAVLWKEKHLGRE